MTETNRARITRLVASNFLSLGEDVSVELDDLTVLAGINGAGKSNVVGALTFVATALTSGLAYAVVSRRGFRALRRHAAGSGQVLLRYEVEHPEWTASYEIAIGPKGDLGYVVSREDAVIDYRSPHRRAGYEARNGAIKNPSADLVGIPATPNNLLLQVVGALDDFAPLYDSLRSVQSYSIYPKALREPSKPSPLSHLDEEGGNWATIAQRVAGGQYGGELKAALARVTGDVIDLEVGQLGDNLAVLFRHLVDPAQPRRNPRFDAGRESDGTLRVAGILTALLQEPHLTMIAIEEPELTIHPGVLPLIHDFLRLATSWSQVVITTHSPDLLDLIDPREIRVVQRLAGTTSVASIDHDQQRLVIEQLFTVGQLMRTEGLAPAEVEV